MSPTQPGIEEGAFLACVATITALFAVVVGVGWFHKGPTANTEGALTVFTLEMGPSNQTMATLLRKLPLKHDV